MFPLTRIPSPLVFEVILPFTCKACPPDDDIDLIETPLPLLAETSPRLTPYVLPITLPETVIPLPLGPLQSISPLT